jgi:ribonuclease BN (tRNA processing enzyme)
VLTHLHGDHFGGIPFILCEAASIGRRNKPLTIIGPPESEVRINNVLENFFPGMRLRYNFPLRYETYCIGKTLSAYGLQIEVYSAIHSPETNPHSVRITIEGVVLAFSGDTEWNDDLLEVSNNSDLFICECTEYERPVKHHMDLKTLKEKSKFINSGKIVVTHLGEECLHHRDAIPFAIAEDGEIIFDTSSKNHNV